MSEAATDDSAPGRDAIDAALRTVYGDREPSHYALSGPAAQELSDKLQRQRGCVALKNLAALTVWIEPSHIRDAAGKVVRTVE